MQRRTFLGLLGSAAAFAPHAARSQQPGRVYRVGLLLPTLRASPAIVAFFDELRLNGFVEGRNLEIIPGGFSVARHQIDAAVSSIVKAAPDAIVGGPERYTLALQKAAPTIPIVGMSEDMIRDGIVTSLARPGGNTTGISILSPELDGKRQDLLLEAAPGTRRMAALVDSGNTPDTHVQKLQDAAQARGIAMTVFRAATHDEVMPAINAAKASGAQVLQFLASPLFVVNDQPFVEHLAGLRLPAMHQWPDTAEQGALLGYGPRFTEIFRQRARQLVKVLRGAKPADIPVEQPTRFELVINLKTAKAIGHEIPAGLVLRADKLVE
jgi:putative ABC transport system substrate-binding protein